MKKIKIKPLDNDLFIIFNIHLSIHLYYMFITRKSESHVDSH